ncbi:transcriptional regulator, GntR family [Lachnospiraceae bacterium KM106-2]|nr:transcriptional regulator, GntR family [Lachnospiraceae bacterium KM106-2]
MTILLSKQSSLAIYEQIVAQIKDAIIDHKLVANEALPSIRGLARELEISVITTKRAYEELEKEGLIYSISGKGFYVSEQNTEILKEKKLKGIEDDVLELIVKCKRAGLSKQDIKDMVDVLYD